MARIAYSLAVAAAALVATSASAQTPGSGPGYSGREVLGSPSDIGIMATTPSRIPSSRREMNRNRPAPFQVRMSPREARRYARDLVARAELQCDVSAAELVAYTVDNIPLIEVDCAEGGLVIADSLPIQATDCFDLPTPEQQAQEGGFILSCRLPGNVARAAAAGQSARN
ncbi:hypothetical protein [Brevundimonas sp.]|uniref:hypothetical protein n=1 Tax=Brevundimonas sp. TaxID=1871086 RepID=UPI002D7657D5|nr:hypothetical protein [Brevundimonas sp.]